MPIPLVVPNTQSAPVNAERGKMPRTAMAICGLYGIPYLYSIYCLIVSYFSGEATFFDFVKEKDMEFIILWVIALVVLMHLVALALLLGFFVGHRLAWYFYRTLGLLGAILQSFNAVVLLAAVGFTIQGGDALISEMAFRILSTLFSLATSWGIYFLLGTESARTYFGAICPTCQSKRIQMLGLFAKKAKCKNCLREWS